MIMNDGKRAVAGGGGGGQAFAPRICLKNCRTLYQDPEPEGTCYLFFITYVDKKK